MGITYGEVFAQVGSHLGALAAESPTLAESTYTDVHTTLTIAQVDNPIFPPSAIRSTVLMVQNDLIRMIASTGNHPWRSLYLSKTAGILSGGEIPAIDENGKQIVGIIGAVRDSSGTLDEMLTETSDPVSNEDDTAGNLLLEDSTATGTPRGVLTAISLNRWRRLNRNAIMHIATLDYYSIMDRLLFHFKDSAVIDVCVFDSAAEAVLAQTPTNMVKVPETLVPALVFGSVGKLAISQGSGLAPLAQAASAYYMNIASQIATGNTSIDPIAVPTPIAQR